MPAWSSKQRELSKPVQACLSLPLLRWLIQPLLARPFSSHPPPLAAAPGLPGRSVVIVRNKTQVIGGITYRTFPGTPAARLGEIAFCAVAQTLQVTGYGTRLMNWTKVGAGAGRTCSSVRGGSARMGRAAAVAGLCCHGWHGERGGGNRC